MKRILLSILTFGAFILTVQGQTVTTTLDNTNSEKDEYFRIGIKGGLNFSNLINDKDGKTKISFHGGLSAEFFVIDKFSIQPELLYSRQGAKANLKDYVWGVGYSEIEADLKLDYINIPVMFKYYPIEGLSLQVGPQIGFLVNAVMDSSTSVFGSKYDSSEDVKDQIEAVDLGMNLGVGYEFSEGVFFDIRYNLGLKKVNKELASGESNVKNGVFQLSVGLRF